jgi:UDPglucose 6-dehydrogenase
MKIAMIGSGYVGLVSGVCFADFGHKVTCIDVDSDKIARLQAGVMPIFEPGLQELVAKNVREKRLSFTTSLKEGMDKADAVFIAVGTPSRRGDGHADLTYVYQAAEEIAREIKDYVVIVTKSTVPVGTGDAVEEIIRKNRPDAQFAVVSNPEFLREGAAINDFKRPDRIVIGTTDQQARDVMSEVYRPLYLNQSPIMFTDRRTSELIKYAANAFLAMKITFINEMADLCEAVGGNVQDVARGIGLDNRIGSKFLHAGPGYGGSCFPKDTKALARTAQEADAPVRLIETTIAVNDQRKKAMAQRIIKACGGSVKNKTIAILGLTFKPNTDDMRDAPALDIIPALQQAGATIRAHDPEGMEHAKTMLDHVQFCDDAYQAAQEADAIAIVTEWDAYRALDLAQLKEVMKTPILVDLRNIYRSSEMARHGFTYIGIGRSH